MIALNYQHPAPAYRLTINGVDITPRINGRLVSLTLTDNRGLEADTLDLLLSDHDGALELPPKGAEIQVAIGWTHEGLVDKGTFIVDEIEHTGSPDQLGIRARSADMREDLPARKSRSWHRTTIGEIVNQIAAEHDLEPVVEQHLAGIRISHREQTSESDLNFLTRLAANYGAIATIKAGKLLFIPAAAATTANGTPLPTITIERSDGDQHRYVIADRDAYTGVRAYWNNVSGGKRQPVIAGVGDNAKELRETYASEADATAAARAELERLQRGVAEFSMTLARGREELIAETPIRLRGFKPEINVTEWVAVKVIHQLSDSGYTVAIECEIRSSPS